LDSSFDYGHVVVAAMRIRRLSHAWNGSKLDPRIRVSFQLGTSSSSRDAVASYGRFTFGGGKTGPLVGVRQLTPDSFRAGRSPRWRRVNDSGARQSHNGT